MAHQQKTSGTSKRGFATMDKEQHRRIASMGGKASHGGRGAPLSKRDVDK